MLVILTLIIDKPFVCNNNVVLVVCCVCLVCDAHRIKVGANICYGNVCYSNLFSFLILKEINAFFTDLYEARKGKFSSQCLVWDYPYC